MLRGLCWALLHLRFSRVCYDLIRNANALTRSSFLMLYCLLRALIHTTELYDSMGLMTLV